MPARTNLIGDPEWPSRGACRDIDPETLFVVGAAQHKAKAICMGCPVRMDCLADALDSRAEFGVWGGMTERERRTLLRRRPDIRSWRTFLGNLQKADQETAAPRPALTPVPRAR
jgi:WhiB family redox-sensing transcriptional regulator